jgi:hypothetical protein
MCEKGFGARERRQGMTMSAAPGRVLAPSRLGWPNGVLRLS